MREPKITQKVIDLLGDEFEIEVGQFDICPTFPYERFTEYLGRYTRDRLSNEPCNILYTLDKTDWYIIFYASWMRCYIIYPAKHLKYTERYDMRKEYKYGRQH